MMLIRQIHNSRLGLLLFLSHWFSSHVFCKEQRILHGEALQECFREPTMCCPEGFILSDTDLCFALKKANRKVLCPKGFRVLDDGKTCEATEAVQANIGCQQGIMENGRCVEVRSKTAGIKCPNGYEMKNGKCHHTTLIAAGLSCKDGYILQSNMCQKRAFVPSMPSCKEGYTYDGTVKKCAKTRVAPVVKQCPQDHIPMNGQCVTTLHQEARPTCPPNFRNIANKCIMQDVIEVKTECEGDAFRSEQGDCVVEQILPAVIGCEDGFTFNSATGQCEKVITRPTIMLCPDGGSLNKDTQKCERKEAVLPAVLCPQGYKTSHNGKKCTKLIERESNPQCPEGYKYDGSSCTALSASQYLEKCPEGFTYSNGTCYTKLYENMIKNCPAGYTLELDQCYTLQQQPPTPVCPEGFQVSNAQCKQTNIIDPHHICGPGFTRQGDQCVESITRQAEASCPPGSSFDPRQRSCIRTIRKPAKYACPKGFERMKGDECAQKVIVNPTLECPPGYHMPSYRSDVCVLDSKQKTGAFFSVVSCQKLWCPDTYTETCDYEPPAYVTEMYVPTTLRACTDCHTYVPVPGHHHNVLGGVPTHHNFVTASHHH